MINKEEGLGFKVIMEEYEHITKESDEDSIYSRNSTITDRTIEDIEVLNANDMGFNVGGDFSIEQLNANQNVIFMYYMQSDSSDSFGIDQNKFVDFVEVFLTEEKAINLKNGVNIIEEAMHHKKYLQFDKAKLKIKLEELNIRIKELGFEKDLTKDTNKEPFSILQYKGENGNMRSLYVNDLSEKYSDEIISMVAKNPEYIKNKDVDVKPVKIKKISK